jgi:hypothetical protein
VDPASPRPDESALAGLYRGLRTSEIDRKLGEGLGEVERAVALAELRRRRALERWRRPVLFIAVGVAIDLALDNVLGEAPLPMGQLLRKVDNALIAALLTGCLWNLSSMFGAQTNGRLARILALVVMLALTLPLALCTMIVGVQFT